MWRRNVPSEVEIAYWLPFDVNYRIRLWCRYKIISLNYQQGPHALVSNFRSDCAGLNVTLELFPWTRNFAPIIWLLSSSTGIFSSVLLGLIAHLISWMKFQSFMTTILPVLTYVECFFFQNMNTSGFRACVKELYANRYDPLSVSYAVLTGL